MIPFGEWRPDLYELNNPLADDVKNVLTTGNSYRPFPGPDAISEAMTGTPLGMFTAGRTDGTYLVVTGNATALYSLGSGVPGAFTAVTRTSGGAYAVPNGNYWEFAQFKGKLIAVNGFDAVQVLDVDIGTNFAALAGSPPVARHVAISNSHVVLGNTATSPRAVQWSVVNDETDWSGVGADSQEFPDGGSVTGLSGRAGIVFQEDAVRAMVYNPSSDLVFEFYPMDAAKGCIAPYSVITVGASAYYLGLDGFYAVSAQGGVRPIGAERVNRTVLADIGPGKTKMVQAAFDPQSSLVMWRYGSNAATGETADRIIAYDFAADRWTRAEVETYVLGQAAFPATSIDDITGSIDDITISLDSDVFAGGRATFACIDSAKKVAPFSGEALEATLTTPTVELQPGRRARARIVRPVADTAAAAVTAYTQDRLGDGWMARSEAAQQASGRCMINAAGRYHKFAVRIPAATAWAHATAVEVISTVEGER